jgi:hypothetical protein
LIFRHGDIIAALPTVKALLGKAGKDRGTLYLQVEVYPHVPNVSPCGPHGYEFVNQGMLEELEMKKPRPASTGRGHRSERMNTSSELFSHI